LKLTSSHPLGLESLREVASQMSLKVQALHNDRGNLAINWKAPPGRYELLTAELLWPNDPVSHFVNGEELELEADSNPFRVNGHAPKVARNGKRCKRRI
jgi:hypothetical protein